MLLDSSYCTFVLQQDLFFCYGAATKTKHGYYNVLTEIDADAVRNFQTVQHF